MSRAARLLRGVDDLTARRPCGEDGNFAERALAGPPRDRHRFRLATHLGKRSERHGPEPA
jgi:hypothetical protein